MIDLKTAKREIAKCATAKLNYPPDKEAAEVLAKALAKHAHSETHAAFVIDSWIEKWPQWPKPSELTQLCQVLVDPRQAEARAFRENCPRCDGSGWISVDGPFGTSAAYPCTHQAETDADRRMGVQMHPATAARYRALDVEAEGRRGLWVGSGGKPNAEALKNITAGKF